MLRGATAAAAGSAAPAAAPGTATAWKCRWDGANAQRGCVWAACHCTATDTSVPLIKFENKWF